jgi:murein DD-endopeptidase MepM/ murein hydrolase activator NlpD
MAAVELATGYVSLVVETSDIGRQVGRMFNGVTGDAGKAGKDMGKAMAKGFAAEEPDLDKLRADVERARNRISAHAEQAASKQEAAARKVEIAEAKVREALEKSGRESSQYLTAVDRLSTSQQKLEAETMDAADSQRKLRTELDKTERELEQTEKASKDAADGYAKGWRGVGQKISRTLRKGVDDATDDAEREAEKGGRESGNGFKEGFKGAIAGMAAYVGIREIVGGVWASVQNAGDAEQSIGAIDAVFKENAGTMHAWSEQASTSVGLAANEYRELGTLIGAQLKNGGTAMDELAPKTDSLIALGADLSSMFGGTTREAVEALSAALKGEMDPIEKYGISLNESAIDAEGAALGMEKVGKSWDTASKQAIVMSLATKQSADAQGNFARESDTFAHKQQVAAAQWSDLTAKIGNLFLPVMSGAMGFLSTTAMPIIEKVVGGVQAFGAAFADGTNEITSSGFAGVMERIGLGLRGAWELLAHGDYTGLISSAFGIEEDHPLIGFLLGVRDGVIAAFEILRDFGAAMWEAREGIGIAVGAITLLLIPTMIRSAGQAAITAAAHVLAWGTKRKEAVKTAATYQVETYKMIGHMVASTAAMGIAAVGHSLAWGKMSGAAMSNALRIAASWFIALGPIGWIVGAIVAALGLIVWAVVANWDKIVGFFAAGWDAVVAFVKPAWEVIVAGIEAGIAWVVEFAGGAWQAAVDIFGAVWQGVADFFGQVYETSIKPLFDGIAAAFAFVGEVMRTVYEATLKPIFDGIAAVATWLWENVLRHIFHVIGQFWILTVDVIVFAWNNWLAPMFASFGKTVSDLWNGILKNVFGFIGTAWGGLVNGIRDFWNGVLLPVFQAVGFYITLMWAKYVQPVLGWVGSAWGGMVNGIRDFWNGILLPVIQAVGLYLTIMWTKYVQPVLGFIGSAWGGMVNGIRDLWNGVLKPALDDFAAFVRFVWESYVKPAFDSIGSAWGGMINGIKDLWNNNLKPILVAVGDFVRVQLVQRIEDGVEMIGNAWETLNKLFATPIKWVIDTVWNNGIVGAFNAVATAVQSEAHLDTIDTSAFNTFAVGGYTGPGGKYQEAGVVHAGEFVLRKEATERLRSQVGLSGLYAINRTGALPEGYFGGGYVNPVSGPITSRFGASRGKYPHAGIDFAVPIGRIVKSALDGVVERLGTNIVTGRSGKGMLVGHDDGRKTYYGHLSNFIAKVGQQVRGGEGIAKSGNTGRSTGPHLHFETWQNGKAVNPLTGGGGLDTGDGGGGFDLLGGLRDLVGGALNGFRDAFPAGGPMVDMLFDTGKHLIGEAVEWGGRKLAEIGDFLAPTGGGLLDLNRGTKDTVKGIASGFGWGGGAQWEALHELVNRESSWRTEARNPASSAYGLFQFLSSTQRQYGYGDDAASQAQGGMKYIAARYGSPVEAIAHHNRKGWYANGGLATPFLHDNGGWHMPGTFSYNGLKKPEAVLTPDEARAFKALAASAVDDSGTSVSAGGGDVYNITVPDRSSAQDYFEAAHRETRRKARGGRY